jgi:hypothetical protein
MATESATSSTSARTTKKKAPEVRLERGAAPEVRLFAKLCRVAGAIERVEKKGKNTHHGYEYVRAADLVAEVRRHLIAEGLIVIPSATNARHEGTLTTVDLEYRFIDSESGAWIVVPWQGVGFDKGGDKGIYKAFTGAMKYVLLSTFLIPTTDDPETDAVSNPRAVPVPAIPRSRAERLVKRAKDAGVEEDAFRAKLAEVGAGAVVSLNVDQAEEVEAWIASLSGGDE